MQWWLMCCMLGADKPSTWSSCLGGFHKHHPTGLPAALCVTAKRLKKRGRYPVEHAEGLCRQQCSAACFSFALDL